MIMGSNDPRLIGKPYNMVSDSAQDDGRIVQRHGRIDDIEVLRGIAVLFVIVHHSYTSLIIWHSKGFDLFNKYFVLATGVNVFFGVSGFVIARSILPSLIAADSVHRFIDITLAFWVRRAWRLLPSAWLWLVLIQIAVLTVNISGAFGTVRANFGALEAGMLNLANVRFAETFIGGGYGASFPYWSLSLEEQFYLVLPLVVFIFRKYIVYFAIIAIIIQWQTFPIQYRLLLGAVKTDGLLMGVLIAIWSNHKSYWRAEPIFLQKYPSVALFTVVMLLVLLPAVSAGDLGFLVSSPAPVTIVCTLLVFIASFDRGYILPAGAFKRAMLWVGGRSYALYLIHIPAFFLTREIWYRLEPAGTHFGGTFTVRFVLTALLILVILSELNYRFVEHPLRVRGAKIAERMGRRSTASAAERGQNNHWLLGSTFAGWATVVMIADAGRTGLLERVFASPVASGQEIAAYPTFEHFAGDGWSSRERWGIWSTGNDSVVNIPVSRRFQGRRRLFVKGSLFLAEKHPAGTVIFLANGVEIGRTTQTLSDPNIESTLDLPAKIFERSASDLRIDIMVDHPTSPYSLGLSLDQRNLGFALVSMRLLEDGGS